VKLEMKFFLLILVLVVSGSVTAAVDIREFESPEQERRYKSLIEELRCTVCQNQNIADSNAELAADLRRKTYELVTAGKENDEILEYMVERYGNFVLYRPPLTAGTLILWAGPFLLFAFGGYVLLRVLRRRRADQTSDVSPPVVNNDKLQQAASLLRDEGDQA